MRLHVRVSLLALICAITVVLVPAAAQAAEAPGVEAFVAVNCKVETCAQTETDINLGPPFGEQKYVEPSSPTEKESLEEGYLQAGGHVPYGITDFSIKSTGSLPFKKPDSEVKHIRTDVAPGLATNPFAVPQCSAKNFGREASEEAFAGSGLGFYGASNCAGSEIGMQHATVFLVTNEKTGEGVDLALEGTVYDVEPKEGLAAEYGVALKLPLAVSAGGLQKFFAYLEANKIPAPTEKEQEFLEAQQYYAHTLIEGNVEWGKQIRGTDQGDYHDYFEINVSTALPLVSSRLDFEGTKGGDFVTNATSCPGHNTTTLKLTDVEEATVKSEYTTPVGLKGCEALEPFAPGFSLEQENSFSDQPDGFAATVSLPQHLEAKELASSQLKTAVFTLPEGMTLDPSAAAGLEACTPAEARIESEEAGTSCPEKSALGTVALEVPTLPAGSLTGKVYLGGPETGPITAPPYKVYIDAESARYGVSVRVEGEVIPNEHTGQVTAVFSKNPEQPFTSLTMQFTKGALAPVANPLACGSAASTAQFTPFANPSTFRGVESAFTVTNGSGGACSSPLPFAPTQEAADAVNTTAGAHTNFAFTLKREEGQQYLSQISTQLPKGLVGAIPVVPLCTEAQATSAAGCPAESLIGKAVVASGSGRTPYTLEGSVYLTEKYEGAPYGLYISVPEKAGPFSLGNVVTRAKINVNSSTGQVIVSSTLPQIVNGGILPRLQSIKVEVNRSDFLSNPTSCGTLATESVVTGLGSPGTSVKLSTPFQVSNCSALAFKPKFSAKASGNPTKKNGASLETTLSQPGGEANIASVKVQLPLQLPSRESTLEKACPAATFEANPTSCSPESVVGGARANTPVLPSKLTGLAYLVGHAGAAFPDLDLVLEANGVRVILVGNTDIKKGITTTTFATTPDVPVSSITVNLPTGPHSALAGYGNLCLHPLVMPTTIVGQNGITFQQNTIIKTLECGVQIVGHKVVGNTAYITVKTPSAGRASAGGSSLKTTYRHLGRAETSATIKVPLSSRGRQRRRPFHVRVRVGFVPSNHHYRNSVAYVTVTVR